MAAGADDDVTKIGDLPALRALADPLRLRVVDLLAVEPRTVKDLAGHLGVARNRLHYHLNVLEKHGIVRVAGADGPDGRRYEPTGRRFETSDVLPVPASVAAGISGVLDTAAREVNARLRSGRRGATAVGRTHVRLSEDQRQDLVNRLQAVIDEYQDAAAATGQPATVVFALYEDPA
ncbi:MAG: winged helix-turn-helix transcriptional regulator [Actinobacteria bacterium]|nr:winged helix-turn-helix transcriptional regulator [Actinomycetota bacterium]